MGWRKSAEAIVAEPTTEQRAEPDMLNSTDFLSVLSRCLARGPEAGSSGRKSQGKAGRF